MGRIEQIFATLRSSGGKALMPYVTGGHPKVEVTEAVIPALADAGASIIEIGIPFSDPIADGPVIAGAMHEALEAGATTALVLDAVKRARERTSVGLVAMVSDSIVVRFGVPRFTELCAAAGIDGLIVPDIDVETAGSVRDEAGERGLTLSMLIAPTTDETRVEKLCAVSSGFVYLLARVGITGEQTTAPEVAGGVEMLRRHTDLPIAVGFGISSPDHVASVVASADAAIVGSALVRRMSEADDPVEAARSFVAHLATGLPAV